MPESKPKGASMKPRNKSPKSGAANPEPGTATLGKAGAPVPVFTRPGLANDNHPRPPAAANDNDPPPPTTPMAAALARPRQRLADAVGKPRVDARLFPLPPRIGRLDEHFFSVELPELNNSVSRGALRAADFAAAVSARLSPADLGGLVRVAPALDADAALYVHGALGVIASSIVRHIRVETGNDATSAGLALVAGLEQALLALGHVTRLAPRDQEMTSWRIRAPLGPPWTWTGTDGERRFGEAVREAERLLGGAERLLWPVRAGFVALTHAVAVFDEATALVLEYRAVQTRLATHPFPAEFLAMRNFLGAFEVGGVAWPGPNATYAPSWNALDLAVGLMGEQFHVIARKRADNMTPDERAFIEHGIALPSLCVLLAETLHGPPLETLSPAAIDQLVRDLDRLDVARSIARLAQATAQLASVHLAAIHKNLEDPVARMTPEERKALGVSPETGVSSTPLSVTKDLRKARMNHPLVEWLTNYGKRK